MAKETWRKGKASVQLDPSCPQYAEQSAVFKGQGYKPDGGTSAASEAEATPDPVQEESPESDSDDRPTRGRGRG